MQSRITIDSNDKDTEVLLIGASDASTVDTSACQGVRFHKVENLSDAIVAARAAVFDIIAIVPDTFDKYLTSAIREFRQLNPRSKVFLLTQMWQESQAAALSYNSNGSKLADDYYVLPVGFVSQRLDIKKPVETDNEKIILQQQHRIEILEKLVMEDELTGVKNRRFVKEFLRQIIERANKESLNVTLLVFDIDNFKKYNDLYGHPVGDNILKQAAVLMQKCCRKQDVVGRVGGDEFAVVFWNLPSGKTISLDQSAEAEERRTLERQHPTQVISICERFRQELNKTDLPALGAEGKGILAISGGLASFPRDGATTQELFAQADKALLEAKRSGKNRVYLIGNEEHRSQSAS